MVATSLLHLLFVPEVAQLGGKSDQVGHGEDADHDLLDGREAALVDVVRLVLQEPLLGARPPRVRWSNVLLMNVSWQIRHLRGRGKRGKRRRRRNGTKATSVSAKESDPAKSRERQAPTLELKGRNEWVCFGMRRRKERGAGEFNSKRRQRKPVAPPPQPRVAGGG